MWFCGVGEGLVGRRDGALRHRGRVGTPGGRRKRTTRLSVRCKGWKATKFKAVAVRLNLWP